MNMQINSKLTVVTRNDISFGYQIAQSNHATADHGHDFPEVSKQWKEESNSIITLTVSSEEELIKLYNKLSKTHNVSLFFEPDIDQHTALCFYADENIRKKLRHLPLAGKVEGKVDRLILDMKRTPQTENQSVWDHGVSVSKKYKELLSYLREGTPLTSEWRLPEWVEDNKGFILDNLLPDDVMRQYQTYHDCGKKRLLIEKK